MSFFLSEGGSGRCIALAIPYDTINKTIMIPNPTNAFDDMSTEFPTCAEMAPARIPRATRIQNSLFSGSFILTPSVWFVLGSD